MTAPRRGAQPTARPRKPAAAKQPAEPVETMEQAVTRIAAQAPVLGGLKHDLIEIAKAAGAYRRTLMAEGFTQLETMAMITEWHTAHWAGTQDEIIDDAEEIA